MAKKIKLVKTVVVSATRVLVAARRAWGNSWYMAGTEGTGAYSVLAITSRGRVGVRDLGGRVRIRVEPLWKRGKIGAVLTVKAGWKQPGDGDQNRFSKVVASGADSDTAIALANKALGVDRLLTARPPVVQAEASSAVAAETVTDENDEEIPF